MSFRMATASSSLHPITTLSGRMKSLIAAPSLRNSGFAATENRLGVALFSWMIFLMREAAPTGTVLFVTITL